MIRPAYWIAIVLFSCLVAAKYDQNTGFTSLIRFGEAWDERRHSELARVPIATVPHSSGYDGQFYAQIALDPTLRDHEFEKVLDAPSYRARRILAPATAAVFGWGDANQTIQAYALLNVGCWFWLAWLLQKIIGQESWTGFARWAGCMFSMGVLDSVRQSLVDLPALLLIALAIHSRAHLRPKGSTLGLALSNLTKETSAFGTWALFLPELFSDKTRNRAICSLLIATLPLALWWLYVNHRFSSPFKSQGMDNFAWPFVALLQEASVAFKALLSGNVDGRYSFGLLAMIGLALQSAVIWSNRNLSSDWWRVGAAYSLLLPLLGLWVWGGYWAACRALLPLTISFNLLLPHTRYFWPIWFLANLTLVHAIWRFL